MVLWHAVDGDAGEKLATVRMEDRPEDEEADDLCQELWDMAREDAETRPQGSQQRYVVQAFRGMQTQPDDSKAFLIEGAAISHMLGGNTEPPNERGRIAQDLRHSDNLHGLVVRLCESTSGSLARALEEERKTNQGLRSEQLKLYAIQQELLDRQHERDMERREREKKDERLESLLTTATSLLPMVVSHLLTPKASGSLPPGQAPPGDQSPGSPGSPGSQSPPSPPPAAAASASPAAARDMATKSLLASLKPEQINAIFESLDPNQTAALMEIYKSHRDAPTTGPAGPPPDSGGTTSDAAPNSEENTSHGVH